MSLVIFKSSYLFLMTWKLIKHSIILMWRVFIPSGYKMTYAKVGFNNMAVLRYTANWSHGSIYVT